MDRNQGNETSFPTGRAAFEHIRRLNLPPGTTEEGLAMHMRLIRRRERLTRLRLDPTMTESEYQEVLERLRRGVLEGLRSDQ